MILFKGESADVLNYNTHEEVIYEYYAKLVAECKQQVKELNNKIAEQRKLNPDEKADEMRLLKNNKKRIMYQSVKYGDLLFKHLSCLNDEDENRVWNDLHEKNIL